jgi:hypothetical protein
MSQGRLSTLDPFLIDSLMLAGIEWGEGAEGSELDLLEEKLQGLGLEAAIIELVISRMVEKKSISEIIQEQGWISRHSVNYHLRRALQLLRERGFK